MAPETLPLWRRPAFIEGARDMWQPALGIGAWGLVTGVAMVKAGFSLPLAVLVSLMVFAGSAQLAVTPLLAAGAPLWVVFATATCVNLRFVIFSAGWRPYFEHLPLARRLGLAYVAGDLNYVLFVKRFPRPEPGHHQEAYYWGGAAVNWSCWQICSLAGIALAAQIPTDWGLAFAGTLALLGLIGSLLVDKATWLACGIAALASLLAFAMPFKLNIVVAIVAAIAAGVVLDRHRARQGQVRAGQ